MRFFTEYILSDERRFFAEFTLSVAMRFFAPLRMTCEGFRMTNMASPLL